MEIVSVYLSKAIECVPYVDGNSLIDTEVSRRTFIICSEEKYNFRFSSTAHQRRTIAEEIAPH